MDVDNTKKRAISWSERDGGQKLSIIMLLALWLCVGAAIGWVAFTAISEGEDLFRIGVSTAVFSGWIWTIYSWSKR